MALDFDYARSRLAAVQPTAYLNHLTKRLDQDGPGVIDALFTIALGKTTAVQYRLQAIKEIATMSGASAYIQAIAIAVAKKQVPDASGEEPTEPLDAEEHSRLEALVEGGGGGGEAAVAGQGSAEGAGGAGDVHSSGLERLGRAPSADRPPARGGERVLGPRKGGRGPRGSARSLRNGEN